MLWLVIYSRVVECSSDADFPWRLVWVDCDAHRAGYLGGSETYCEKYIDFRISYGTEATICSNLCLTIIIPGNYLRVAGLPNGRRIGA